MSMGGKGIKRNVHDDTHIWGCCFDGRDSPANEIISGEGIGAILIFK